MTVRCLDCSLFNLRSSPLDRERPRALGRSGFGLCKAIKSEAHLFSAHHARQCKTFSPAPPETIARRQSALDQGK